MYSTVQGPAIPVIASTVRGKQLPKAATVDRIAVLLILHLTAGTSIIRCQRFKTIYPFCRYLPAAALCRDFLPPALFCNSAGGKNEAFMRMPQNEAGICARAWASRTRGGALYQSYSHTSSSFTILYAIGIIHAFLMQWCTSVVIGSSSPLYTYSYLSCTITRHRQPTFSDDQSITLCMFIPLDYYLFVGWSMQTLGVGWSYSSACMYYSYLYLFSY